MALINTLRNKAGVVITVAIGVSILAFVFADLTGPNSALLRDDTVGEIAGHVVTREEFNDALEQIKTNYYLQTGQNPSTSMMYGLRNQAWDLLISKYAFQKEYDELGVEVTDDEIVDMTQGDNISPLIEQNFRNPQTGEFNKQDVINFLNNFPNQPPEIQNLWIYMEQQLPRSRVRLKYENLLMQTNYVPTEMAKQEYREQTAVAEAKILRVPFVAIPDSAVTVTDDEIRSYIREHEDEYETEAERDLIYVTFSMVPSAADTAYYVDELEELKPEFRQAENDSTFAALNTERGNQPFKEVRPPQLPPVIQDDFPQIEVGAVFGPVLEGNKAKIYKVSGFSQDTLTFARARHILLKTGENKEDAEVRSQAQELLQRALGGEDFASLARQYSEDGSSANGGDLGWTNVQNWVAPFRDAVTSRDTPGIVPRLVESQFGYHIIQVTNPATSKMVKLAEIAREITASEETVDEAYREAEFFLANVDDVSSFREQAAADSLSLRTARGVGKDDRGIMNLFDARNIVFWAYNQADEGSVSEIFTLENEYVIAALVDAREAGIAEVDEVRGEVTEILKNRKKADVLIDRLSGMEGSLEEIANAFGSDASITEATDINLDDNSIAGIGFDPVAVGRIFGLEAGQRTDPFMGENAVIIAELLTKTDPGDAADYTVYKDQISQNQQTQVARGIYEVIRDQSDIEDKRYTIY